MRRKWIAIFAVLSALFLSGLPVQAAESAGAGNVPQTTVQAAARQPLGEQVQAWANALSNQAPFQAWKTATSVILPLGPGTHGWLVTFNAGGKPVGYMIVNAKEDGGYQLGEYGAGQYPAFNAATMYNALIRQGLVDDYAAIAKKPLHLERLYLSPMTAAWKWTTSGGEIYYLDPWTGEALPIDDSTWAQQSKATSAAFASGQASAQSSTSVSKAKPMFARLTAARTNHSFDPFERMPWLTNAPLSQGQLQRLPAMLDGHTEIRYTAELYEQTVLFVLPAIGYHRWDDGRLFVAFDQSVPGTRYIPLDALKSEGHFFK